MSGKHSSRIVVKFGGSSLSDADRITRAAQAVAREASKGKRLVVVVSAMGKTTDELLELVKSSARNPPPNKEVDEILAMGERTSVRVFASALKAQGLSVKHFDPEDEDWPIVTDNQFSNANPLLPECFSLIDRNVVPLIENGSVPIIPGFVGKTTHGEITTIGRGGSDTTAFIVARAIKADEVILVTDADGIMTADPKLVPSSRRVETIDAARLVGLAGNGRKFIQLKALRYKDPRIPVRVISHEVGDLSAPGSLIRGGISSNLEVYLESKEPCLSVTVASEGIARHGKLVGDITAFAAQRGNVLGFSSDADSLILYLSTLKESPFLEELHSKIIGSGAAIGMAVRRNLAFMKIYGVGLEERPGLVGAVSHALSNVGINIYGILTISSSILVFVSWQDSEKAVQVVRSALRLTEE